jgi:hypothetical protein
LGNVNRRRTPIVAAVMFGVGEVLAFWVWGWVGVFAGLVAWIVVFAVLTTVYVLVVG